MNRFDEHNGQPYPLGATITGDAVNFAIYSEHAERVELILFDSSNDSTGRIINLQERTAQVWHTRVPGIAAGQLYGYRVYGPYQPTKGHRFNNNKLLLDPYAKAICGAVKWNDALFGYNKTDTRKDLSFNDQNSAAYAPKCVVVDDYFDWEDTRAPVTAYHRSIIYEAHIIGLTKLHPAIPDELRGTYAGISHPAIIDHLLSLGVTAIELMPVHHFIDEHHLVQKGLRNYWGYNSIGFFAPHGGYSSSGTHGEQVREFKQMVKTFHKAGIDVILDVVYSHTAEGDEFGPTLSFRGIENHCYYRHPENKQHYIDFTGCGNTLDTRMPYTLQLITDSLRYWIQEMHVDGFRFDLAATLARERYEVEKSGAFFDIIHQDPVISQVKLIAEPWDLGPDGNQQGKFPAKWAEWNGKYRDCMRDFWRGGKQKLEEFATRFAGSPDLYQNDYRRPCASINYITSHDGFTMADLVQYSTKHNEANKDDNTDGTHKNYSANYGIEGPTEDAHINAIRKRQQKNFIATLFLSQGIPMLLAGDEMNRTQQGNNNAYCQDNEITWMNWEEHDVELLEFVKKLIRIRMQHPCFNRRHWFQGSPIIGDHAEGIAWFSTDGTRMNKSKWKTDYAKTLGVFLTEQSDNSKSEVSERFFILLNAHDEGVEFTLPSASFSATWNPVFDTAGLLKPDQFLQAGEKINVEDRSFILLQG